MPRSQAVSTPRYRCFAGRLYSKRQAGPKLIFYDLHGEQIDGEDTVLQVLANARYYSGSEDFFDLHERIKRGDIVGFIGHPSRSKSGELSITPTEVVQLTPSLHPLPHTHYGLKDQETR